MVISEQELILKAKNGDDYAFETLLSNYKNLVVSISRKYFLVGGDVDDLIQEGMIALFRAVKTFDETKGVTFTFYAKTIIERQIINAIKKANNKKNTPLNDYVELNSFGVAPKNENFSGVYISNQKTTTPEDLVLNNETVKQMISKIKEVLSAYELNVLELYLESKPYREIALILNKTNKSIDNALKRIKNKLQFLKHKS